MMAIKLSSRVLTILHDDIE